MLPKACASYKKNQTMSFFYLTVDKDNLFFAWKEHKHLTGGGGGLDDSQDRILLSSY